ncbi:MAG TPA: tyrosine-type recombinase/integrase, partial [Xanthobacteraceae bacterium]|nr:tyrosine-type recombinase/integrase [Xanthobacteraceae bacterium]
MARPALFVAGDAFFVAARPTGGAGVATRIVRNLLRCATTWRREARSATARVLSPEEVLRLLEAAPGPKHKAALSVACGAGLRAMEVVALKVSDIDSKRMMLRVEQGKGRKDRFAMLSPQLLELLRDWWRIARPTVWIFPGRDRISPMSTRQLNR